MQGAFMSWFAQVARMLIAALVFLAPCALAQNADYRLGSGDVVRITVYNNADLSTEAQITNAGRINFPLIGEVAIGGLGKDAAEQIIAKRLSDGGFVKQPQVNVLVLQYRSLQISVLGQVNKPGKFPLETASNLADVLALAGGIAPSGSDVVTIIKRAEDGKQTKVDVDLNAMMMKGDLARNIAISNGDIIYVPRAPLFYIYGEVQRPGAYRLERDMTVMQALSVGGGLNVRGTDKGIRLNRHGNGKVETLQANLNDPVVENDVIFVRESLF